MNAPSIRSGWIVAATCAGLACSPGGAGPGATGLSAPGTGEGPAGSSTTDEPTGTGAGDATTNDMSGTTGAVDTAGAAPDLPEPAPDPNDAIPPLDDEGCPGLYAQELLPTFEVTMAPEVWQALQDEWNNGKANEEAGLDYNPYHPLIEFKYGDIVLDDAAIRLRGNTTFWNPLPGDKMQFQIGFHTVDPKGRFLGLMRLALDAATANRHMLRDRLALAVLRAAGVRAPCANNARLIVNGEYYGLFTNIEKLDEMFLQRTMEDPSGDLFDRHNWELKTNTDTSTGERIGLLKGANTLAELDAILDIDQALLTYAAEAVIPDSDGSWAGGLNFFVYDDPKRGKFMLLPWDLDNTFERFSDGPEGDYPENPDPYLWEKPTTHGRPWYGLIVADPARFEQYVDLIDQVVQAGYDTGQLHARIDQWSAQIEDAALSDMNKPYSNDQYHAAVDQLRDFVAARRAYLDDWLSCWQGGGKDDGTGHCVKP